MAKKFVRGITDVKTITNQDYDTNNVNDLLSDGQYNYIHRKKGKTEEYHNLTDNIKTLSSDNTELLSVTNNNKTTNTATLHPKHDKQKEQVLESTRDTITINHGTNGTAEKTTVDTNPLKVLEHENLFVGDGLSVSHSGNKSTIKIEPTFKESGLNLDTLENGVIRGTGFTSSVTQQATTTNATYLTFKISENEKFQISLRPSLVQGDKAIIEYRFIKSTYSTNWMTAPTSMSEISSLLAQKQDTLVAGDGITIEGQTISATGATSTIEYNQSDGNYQLFKYVVTNGYDTFVTYTFNVYSGTPQLTFVDDLKNDLERFVGVDSTVSNGALKLTNDGTNIKLINSKSTEDGSQQGTFTFYERTAGGGGGETAS